MSDIVVETIKLGSRCQMVLPAKIRKVAGLSEGDEVLVGARGPGRAVPVKEILSGMMAQEFYSGSRNFRLAGEYIRR